MSTFLYARNHSYATGPKWLPDKVIKVLGNAMYNVRTDRGVWRRHRNQLQLGFSDLNASDKKLAGDNRVVDNSNFDGENLVDDDHASSSNARAESSVPDSNADVRVKRNLSPAVVDKRYPTRNRRRPDYFQSSD